MADLGTKGGRGGAGLTGVKQIALSLVRPMVFAAGRNDSEGNPASPCLAMPYPGVFRFRWAVRAGTRSISVSVKQSLNASPRPSITVKASPGIGIASDVSASAASGTGWVTAGPAVVTPTSDGVVYVELANNTTGENDHSCYFDHITTT